MRKEITMSNDKKPLTSVALFQEKTVRRVWFEDRWFFSVIDVIAILTDSDRPRKYWSDLKTKLIKEGLLTVARFINLLYAILIFFDTLTFMQLFESNRSEKEKGMLSSPRLDQCLSVIERRK